MSISGDQLPMLQPRRQSLFRRHLPLALVLIGCAGAGAAGYMASVAQGLSAVNAAIAGIAASIGLAATALVKYAQAMNRNRNRADADGAHGSEPWTRRARHTHLSRAGEMLRNTLHLAVAYDDRLRYELDDPALRGRPQLFAKRLLSNLTKDVFAKSGAGGVFRVWLEDNHARHERVIEKLARAIQGYRDGVLTLDGARLRAAGVVRDYMFELKRGWDESLQDRYGLEVMRYMDVLSEAVHAQKLGRKVVPFTRPAAPTQDGPRTAPLGRPGAR